MLVHSCFLSHRLESSKTAHDKNQSRKKAESHQVDWAQPKPAAKATMVRNTLAIRRRRLRVGALLLVAVKESCISLEKSSSHESKMSLGSLPKGGAEGRDPWQPHTGAAIRRQEGRDRGLAGRRDAELHSSPLHANDLPQKDDMTSHEPNMSSHESNMSSHECGVSSHECGMSLGIFGSPWCNLQAAAQPLGLEHALLPGRGAKKNQPLYTPASAHLCRCRACPGQTSKNPRRNS